MSDRYQRLLSALETDGVGTMKCRGNSMLPILSNPCINTYQKQDRYEVGDIVFCKVKGRFIDAHKITAIGPDGRYLIANNHGYENGWTRTIYGRVIQSVDETGKDVKNFGRYTISPFKPEDAFRIDTKS